MNKELNLPIVMYRIAGSIIEFAEQSQHAADCVKDDTGACCSCGMLETMSEIVNHAREIQQLLAPEKDSL